MNWTRLATAVLSGAAVLRLAGVPALAQSAPVRISRPAPEQTVRGAVPIVINASAVPSGGYMTVEVNDEFMAAVAPEPGSNTVTYMWDTKAQFPETTAPPRDGQYTIRVKTYTPGFRFVRSNELNVYLRNRISIPANRAVRLAYRFAPDTEFSFVEQVTVRAAGQTLYSANVPVTLTINDVSGGVAEARERIDRNAYETVSGQRQPLSVAGRSFSVTMAPNGAVSPGPRMRRAGVSPAVSLLTFPNRAVRVGETWTNSVRITPYYNGVLAASVSGTHKLVGLEYFNNRPAARIESSYDGVASVSVAGILTPVTFRGKRTTFFDYNRGRLMRAEDNLTADFGTGSAAMPGMPADPSQANATRMTIVTAAR